MSKLNEQEIEKANQVIDLVINRASIGINSISAIRQSASQRITELRSKIPFAFAEFLVTGKREVVTSLYDEIEFQCHVLSESQKAEPLLMGNVDNASNIRRYIAQEKLSLIPEGAPETWWPAYLTAEDGIQERGSD